MRAALGIASAIGALVIGGAATAHAAQPARTGFAAGVGLGGASVSWTWPDDERRVEESGAGNARAAWALNPELLVGVEFWGWSKDYEIGSIPEDVPAEVRLWAAALSVTYFPGNTGFYLRGGIGLAGGRATIDPPASVSFPVSGSQSDTGLSALGAIGYETGITDHMALGAAAHAVYLGVDQGPFGDTFGYGLSVQLNWYW